jgi:hypothetical protein
MLAFLKKPFWSPYVAGALVGLMPVALYIISNWHVGGSGPFMDIAKVLMSRLRPGDFGPQSLVLGYRLMFLPGIVLGGYVAAKLGGTRETIFMPQLWRERVGTSRVLRAFVAFMGGFFLIVGAYLALGCTISRVIWGGARLDIGAWVLMASMFAAAVITTWLLYSFRRNRKAQR